MHTTNRTLSGRVSPLDRIPTSYPAATAYLGNRDYRTCGNNTGVLRQSDGSIAVVLHRTPVVTFHRDGTARLTTGGWRSVTTKERLNRVLRPHGFNVYAKRGEWRLSVPESYGLSPLAGQDIDFYDGMTVCLDAS